ncbi:unnamed protein product [Diplocarpon coronariae]
MGGGPERMSFAEGHAIEQRSKGDKNLRGVVDMGSNGIRFSVSSLAPPTSRILPTLVSYRLDISLYSAQYDDETGERIPIPDDIINLIIAALMRFRVICRDLKVPEKHIRIVATEATRTAVNSVEYRKAIKEATGLEVEMLGKEEEGYVGALGVASGFSTVSGIVMDLGGGSTQITWMRSTDGKVQVSPKGSISFPYGAAALAFLVNVLTEALPHGIKEAHFCQGGVREGVLFRELPQDVRDEDPLEVATQNYGRKSADALSSLLLNSIPTTSKKDGGRAFPESISKHVIHAFANVLYVHAHMSKEIASTAALYCTSSGFMASAHGVSHSDRALLGLMLEERYEGELPPREADFKLSLQSILTPEEIWWTRYLGAVGLLISKIYPAGNFDEDEPRIKISSEWASGFGKNDDKEGLRLTLYIKKIKNDPMMLKEALNDHVGNIHKVGKHKNWIGGANGWGMSINIKIEEVQSMVQY